MVKQLKNLTAKSFDQSTCLEYQVEAGSRNISTTLFEYQSDTFGREYFKSFHHSHIGKTATPHGGLFFYQSIWLEVEL